MRLGVDLDTLNRLQLLKAYFNLRHMFPKNPMITRLSAGGGGYHVIVYGTKLTKEQNLVVRECFCDDPNHVEVDRETAQGRVHKPFLIFWTKKGKRTVEEVDPLAEPWKIVRNKVVRNNGKRIQNQTG